MLTLFSGQQGVALSKPNNLTGKCATTVPSSYPQSAVVYGQKYMAEAYATTRPVGNATRGGKYFTASRNSLVRS